MLIEPTMKSICIYSWTSTKTCEYYFFFILKLIIKTHRQMI